MTPVSALRFLPWGRSKLERLLFIPQQPPRGHCSLALWRLPRRPARATVCLQPQQHLAARGGGGPAFVSGGSSFPTQGRLVTRVWSSGVDQTWASWAGGLQSGPRCVWGVPPSQGAAIIQEKAQHPPGFTMSHAKTNVCPAAGQLNVRPAPPGTSCRDSPARSGVGSAQPHFGPGASFKNTHLFSNDKVKFKKRFPSRAHGFGRPLPVASLSTSPASVRALPGCAVLRRCEGLELARTSS